MKLGQFQQMDRKKLATKKYYLIYCRKSSESEDRQAESIPAQLSCLTQLAKEKSLPILRTFKESKSAKAPGRPKFNEMVQLIEERPDIKGIICWKLNRLSRNPVDSGTIQWLLQKKSIDEIITPTKTYLEADSDFVMAVEGAQANRFIRDLREDTQRGIQRKIDKGIAPLLAPPGYKNNTFKRQGEKDISPHPIFFSLMRKIFDLALTDNFTLEDLRIKAEGLGIKSARGTPISHSNLYRVLTNPFYTGRFLYAGKLYQGVHKPMLTDSEFDLLQDILSDRFKPRKIKHNFPLLGVLRCGNCGMGITAESHTKQYKNGNSQTFTYYRCTRKSKTKKCNQPFIPAEKLEKQVLSFLKTIEISPFFVEWAGRWLKEERLKENTIKEKSRRVLQKSLKEIKEKILKTVELSLIDSSLQKEDVHDLYNRLKAEKARLELKIANIDQGFDDLNDLTLKTFNFASTAKERFISGSPEVKRTILRAIGSNLILKDRKLDIQPRAPFLLIKGAVKDFELSSLLARTKEKAGIQDNSNEGISIPTFWGG